MSERIEDLAALEIEAWDRLAKAVSSYRAPFHSGTVASAGIDGAPQVRTVVVRSADAASRKLSFHTDRRSPKFAELSADPRMSWLFYDEPSRTQLRLIARASLHLDDAVADAHWRGTSLNSRRAYAAHAAPGTALAAAGNGLIEDAADERWTLAASEACRPHFAVVTTIVSQLEIVVLHHLGHRRARFDYSEDAVTPIRSWRIP